MTSIPIPRSPLMMDSLAEHVPDPVITYTRDRLREGSSLPAILSSSKPMAVVLKSVGVNVSPVTGFRSVCLSLKTVCEKTLPCAAEGPAIIYASWFAIAR